MTTDQHSSADYLPAIETEGVDVSTKAAEVQVLTDAERADYVLLDGVTVTELPGRVVGIWGSERVFCGGIQYGRCHGGPWFEESRTCTYQWGDFGCEKTAHGPDEKHSLVWINTEDDIDPRLT